MELDQYLFFRDVGFGGLGPGGLDLGFRGGRPHRNRSALELALMTGMRIQEWSTLLLPVLGLVGGRQPAVADVDLGACAKYGRPRSVYVPRDAMERLDPYLLLERPGIVATAQRTLRRQVRELFVVQRIEGEGTRVRGILEGVTVTRVIKDMKPDLRRITVLETGGGLDPLGVHRPGRPDAHRFGLGPHPLAGVEADEAVERGRGGPGVAPALLGLPRHAAHVRAAASDLPDPRGSR
ncbi:hypothetical protein [Streptomyces sp. NPDC001537]